ncbi:hypothetical protein F4777DRAFT_88206 [Nemania sp. FL0916]|nr:hypothetical protein F4777DRAFT_88206 [Nemania sp. FL0916]
MTPTDTNEAGIRWSLWSRQVINNQLNPICLGIGTRGYRIQSEILHVPERWGIFSHGPPRLQVYQGQAFMGCCAIVAFIAILNLLADFVLFKLGRIGTFHVVILIGVDLCGITSWAGVIYEAMRRSPQRRPGYVWDDWKEAQD